MFSPISRTSEIEMTVQQPAGFKDEFFNAVIRKLDDSDIANRKRIGDRLTFAGAPFRFAYKGWNLFNGISSGTIHIYRPGKGRKSLFDQNRLIVHYSIYFFEYFLWALLFTVIPACIFYFNHNTAILLATIIWIIYSVLCFLSVVRFDKYFREEVFNATKKPDKKS